MLSAISKMEPNYLVIEWAILQLVNYKYEINYKQITNYNVNKLKLVISISQVSNISSEEISKIFTMQPDWSIHLIICNKYNMEKISILP